MYDCAKYIVIVVLRKSKRAENIRDEHFTVHFVLLKLPELAYLKACYHSYQKNAVDL